MTKEQAQKELFKLSKKFYGLLNQIDALDNQAGIINDERRKILQEYPTLDLGIEGEYHDQGTTENN